MSDLLDVMEATEGSGATMLTTLFDYGNSSLRGGILRLADEMYLVGYEQGARNMYSIAFGEGLSQGRKEGAIVTIIAGGAITFLTWGIYKLLKKKKGDDEKIYSINAMYSSEDGWEITSGEQIEILQKDEKIALIRKITEPNKVYSIPLVILNSLLAAGDANTIA